MGGNPTLETVENLLWGTYVAVTKVVSKLDECYDPKIRKELTEALLEAARSLREAINLLNSLT